MTSGHEDQFVAELTAIQLPLRLYVQSLLPGDPASRDVAQEANTTIWRKRGDFESGTNFKAWAFSIARYEVLNYRKKQAREARLSFSEELEATFAAELSEQDAALEQRHEALRMCLDELRPKHRELVLHRYAGNGTLREFADQSGHSVGTLKVTLHRLRNSLLQCIERRIGSREAEA